jgi:hypothetical protein
LIPEAKAASALRTAPAAPISGASKCNHLSKGIELFDVLLGSQWNLVLSKFLSHHIVSSTSS